jgi:2,3-bisphosphoglycerate-dependent phosphoglycerate mutase
VTHLYLIRHGEAVGAIQRRVADQIADAGLTPLGRSQAARLRDRLAATHEIAADVLIASTFARACETAEIIAPALGNLPLTLDDEVQELRTGEADGLLWEEFDSRYGPHDFDLDPYTPVAPGGESWSHFKLRVGAALHRIIREHTGKTIVIVCHGGVIDGSFLYFFGLPTLTHPPIGFLTHNTSITEWESYDHRGSPRWRLVRYNDDLHLRDNVQWVGVSAEAETGADTPAVPLPTEERERR